AGGGGDINRLILKLLGIERRSLVGVAHRRNRLAACCFAVNTEVCPRSGDRGGPALASLACPTLRSFFRFLYCHETPRRLFRRSCCGCRRVNRDRRRVNRRTAFVP